VVGDFTSYLRERTMVKVLPILLELAAHTPELRAGITAPHRRALESVLRRGIEAGDLDARLDLSLAPALLFGPLLFRVLVTGEQVDASTVSSLVGSFLKSHGA
jgi:hypothetical protein